MMLLSGISYLNRLEVAISGLPALSTRYPQAAGMLAFLAPVLESQRQIAVSTDSPCSLSDAASLPWIAALRDIAASCAAHGTPEISSAALALSACDDGTLCRLVSRFINGEVLEGADRLMVMAYLGAIAVGLPQRHPYNEREWLKPDCPVCGLPPVASLLADVEEIEGCRLLYCGVCHASWHFNRTTCHCCGSNDDQQFDYFHPDGDVSVVVQACRNCMGYLKTIDMRQFGMMIPEVLDTATVSLDLYAREKGFIKEFPAMFGY